MKNPLLQRLDPRTKLAAAAIVIGGLLWVDKAIGLALFAILIVTAAILAHFPLRYAVFAGFALWPLLAITLLVHGLANPSSGEILASFWGFSITTTGLERGALFAVRLLLFIFISRIVLYIGSGESYARALGRLCSPLRRFRLPIGEMELIIAIAFRLIPILEHETGRLVLARRARGAATNWVGKLRQLPAILVPLFVGAFRRADALAIAMEARGFVVGAPRSSYAQTYFAALDFLILILVAGITILAIAFS